MSGNMQDPNWNTTRSVEMLPSLLR